MRDLSGRRSIWRCLLLSEFLAQCLWTASAISSRIETLALLPHHKPSPYMIQKWNLIVITCYPLYIPVVPRIYENFGIAGAFFEPNRRPTSAPTARWWSPWGQPSGGSGRGEAQVFGSSYEPLSKLLVSPLISPIVVPYIIPYITPLEGVMARMVV